MTLAVLVARTDAASVRSVTGSLGLLATAVLLGLLLEHEIVSAVAPRWRRHRRIVELLVVPLLVVFAAVVVARFTWLTV
jgi:hypothetical protein